MPKKITNIHDKFFKKIISDKEVAIHFFDTFLPVDTRKKMVLSTLEYQDTTYIDEKLGINFADAVFTCETEKDNQVKVVILIEHKSYVDKNTPIQVLYYIASALMQQVIRKEDLQVIIPVVFYHGKQKWEYISLENLFESDFLRYIPSFETIFVDLYRISDENLSMIRNAFLSSILLTQKYCREPQVLADNLVSIFNALNPRQRNLFYPLTVYFISLVKLDKNDIFEKINTLPSKIKNEIMSTYDMILDEGLQKGLQKGLKEGLQKVVVNGYQKGLSIELLASMTELSKEEVIEILKTKNLLS